MADLQKIVDDLSSLTVLEAAELAKLLEEKWGVSAAAAVVVAGPAAAAAAPAEEKTEFTVMLTAAGEKKIEVIKEVARSPASASRKPRTSSKAPRRPSRKASTRTKPTRSRPSSRRPAPRLSSSNAVTRAQSPGEHRQTGGSQTWDGTIRSMVYTRMCGDSQG